MVGKVPCAVAGARRFRHLLLSAILVGSVAVANPSRASAGPYFVEFTVGSVGPRGPIVLVGDSVLLGSTTDETSYAPSLPSLLIAQGWGPVYVKAGGGFSTGLLLGRTNGANSAEWVMRNRRETGGAPAYVVVLGNNDTGLCGSDSACMEASIRFMLSAIGPGPDVWWSKITLDRQSRQVMWNDTLSKVAADVDNLQLWDWPAVQAATGIRLSDDRVHLAAPVDYRRKSALMADDVTGWLGRLRPAPGEAPVSLQSSGPASGFRAVVPSRVADTRSSPRGRLRAGAALTVDLSASIPVGAVAASVNLTAVEPTDDGFLSVFPCGSSPPPTSNLNYRAQQTRGAQAVVAVGADRHFCVRSSSEADVIVDLQGVFALADGDLFAPQPPVRLIDTRSTGRAASVSMAVDPSVRAVAVNLTATGATNAGYLTAYGCGATVPSVSNVNFGPGETIAGSAFVAVGPDHRFCVTASANVDVIVDVTGTFGEAGTLRFTPALPSRRLDTRSGLGGRRGLSAPGEQIEVAAAPPTAGAVTGTLTLLASGSNAFLTAFPCAATTPSGPPPSTSNVNAPSGSTVANSITVGATDGHICVASSSGAKVLFDATGWWS
jgi:hypothetical protein